jgi:hypothetical protein
VQSDRQAEPLVSTDTLSAFVTSQSAKAPNSKASTAQHAARFKYMQLFFLSVKVHYWWMRGGVEGGEDNRAAEKPLAAAVLIIFTITVFLWMLLALAN